MDKPKSLQEFLSNNVKHNDVYSTDKKKRKWRSNKGYFSKDGDSPFDFIFLIKRWDEIVGKMLAQNTIPQKIVRATLIVMTKHPIFAQELGMISPQIIRKIESQIPALRGKINKIKFSHSEYSWESFQEKTKEPTIKEREVARKLHPFSPEFKLKKQQALEIFKDIEDDDFRESLVSLFILNND